MKLGGPEGGGGFMSRAKDIWNSTDFEAIDAERQAAQAEKQAAEQQARLEASLKKQEQAQSPEAQDRRNAKIQEMIDSFNRLATNSPGGQPRTNIEVDQFLRSTNSDVRNTSLGAEAWSRWQEQRAQATVDAATDNVVPLDNYRKDTNKVA